MTDAKQRLEAVRAKKPSCWPEPPPDFDTYLPTARIRWWLAASRALTADENCACDRWVDEMEEAQLAYDSENKRTQSEYSVSPLKVMGVPKGLRRMTLEAFNITAAWRIHMDHVLAGKNLLLCAGDERSPAVGVGKTHFFTAMLPRLWDLSGRGRFDEYRWLSSSIWGMKLGNAGIKQSKLIERLHDARVVYIDDLGQEEKGKQSSSIITTLNAAYNAGAQLLASSNLTQDQLVERYGEAIISRFEGDGGRIVPLTGKDKRVKPNEGEKNG